MSDSFRYSGQNAVFFAPFNNFYNDPWFQMPQPSEWVFHVASLELYSPGLMTLLIDLWAELDQEGVDASPADLATWISGIATGIEYTEPAYLQCSFKSGAIADLRTLESVLIMRGRCAA